jgi:para-aminobenzoate synthetase component 1
MESREFLFDDLEAVKLKLYHFSGGFEYCNIYDSNESPTALDIGKYELIGALGFKTGFPGETMGLFSGIENSGAWVFGHLEYQDIVAETIYKGLFYEPQLVFYILKHSQTLVFCNNGISEAEFLEHLSELENYQYTLKVPEALGIEFIPQTDKMNYLQQVEVIKDDIVRGRYYEMNYCIEFKASAAPVDLLPYYLKLNEKTRAPFAAFVKHPGLGILCSSPERFLLRKGEMLYSQPIKGTNQRLEGDGNLMQMQELRRSEKEFAENVMIVDLVRNDLARVCRHGTVHVDELCGTYAFRTVNHLISTVSGQLEAGMSLKDMVWALFPMGSMTGAPKTEVMKHIKKYEHDERGVYSGCMGYIEPGGDFDFNVVIRSLVYDGASSVISYKVGGAITYDSVAEKEYEECLLKGKRLFEAMTGRV